MTSSTKQKLIVGFSPLALLLIPLVAMQFTSEVNWGPLDFIIAGGLLCSLGFSLPLISSKIETLLPKVLAIGLFTFIIALIWAELAVGIF